MQEAQGASDTQQCTELRTELQAVKASGTAELASLSAEALKKSKVARTLLDEKDKQLEVAKEIMVSVVVLWSISGSTGTGRACIDLNVGFLG